MNKEHIEALDLCLAGHNILLTGQAGTGKSYLAAEIAHSLTNLGKRVQVTCTTGIATQTFPKNVKAVTLHKWSGLDDGRYDASEIIELLKTSPHRSDTLCRIRNTDVLIIDEISMLSKKLFEQLEKICAAVRGENGYFGNLQLILVGDFYQLPPVANTIYNDSGELCFTSEIFDKIIGHTVTLKHILRQNDQVFSKIINKLSIGDVDDSVMNFMNAVERPLKKEDSIKLFSTNFLVDTFNRNKLIQSAGDVVEYCATDNGERKHLSKLTAQGTLWLKRDVLVNGLRGDVIGFDAEGPVVKFKSIPLTTTIKRHTFSVYSPDQRRNLATRVQLPLKLAYAMTIHKAQGMTLDSVEIDCRDIFRAGQLGVAVGRVRTVDGLRVINFHPKYCLPQPGCINDFLMKPSQDPVDSMTCCRQERNIEDTEDSFTIDEDYETYDIDPSDDEFDKEFDEILRTLDTEEPEDTASLPDGFSVTEVLESIKPTGDITTPKQKGVVQIVTNLTLSSMQNIIEFCKKTFIALDELIEEMNITEPVSVKPESLTKFYTKCHEYQTSPQYRLNCMLCFKEENVLNESHWYVTYKLTVAVRKHILSQKEKLFPTSERHISNRDITESSRARIRYVGGYCINKIRRQQLAIVKQNMYTKSADGQRQYHQACELLNIVNNFREVEEHLTSTSEDPKSLLDTIRKQYSNKGLTHISDELYKFFLDLCKHCLNLLVDRNLNERHEHLFEYCWRELITSKELLQQLMKACTICREISVERINVDDEPVDVEVRSVMDDMLNTIQPQPLAEHLLEIITKSFLFIMLVQFRSDLLQSFRIAKTMEHRKQVQTKKTQESAACVKHLTFTEIQGDMTENKKMTHSLLQGLLMRDVPVFRPMTKKQLGTLCRAYNIQYKSKMKNIELITMLSQRIVGCSQMDNPTVLNPQAEPDAQQPSTSTASADLCAKCHKIGTKSVQWIQCDTCNKWLHQNCAGLRSQRDWDRYKGVNFYCKECV